MSGTARRARLGRYSGWRRDARAAWSDARTEGALPATPPHMCVRWPMCHTMCTPSRRGRSGQELLRRLGLFLAGSLVREHALRRHEHSRLPGWFRCLVAKESDSPNLGGHTLRLPVRSQCGLGASYPGPARPCQWQMPLPLKTCRPPGGGRGGRCLFAGTTGIEGAIAAAAAICQWGSSLPERRRRS